MAQLNRQDALQNSLLADLSALPIKAAETIKSWGKTLIVAPHPDDESLGCGGAIALLRRFEIRVEIVVMSDGTKSHPNSQEYPAERLRDLREVEMLEAAAILGVAQSRVRFLRYPDRAVPQQDSPGFAAAVARFAEILENVQPATILAPWRRDPHPDHLAAHQIAATAIRQLNRKIRVIEYPIWLWELARRADAPRRDEATAWRLDIAAVNDQKQAAIRAHRSQTTDLINDDPAAFRLTPEILEHFADSREIYLETQ